MSNQEKTKTIYKTSLRSVTQSNNKAKLYVRLIIDEKLEPVVAVSTLLLADFKDVPMLTNFNDKYILIKRFKDYALVQKTHFYRADTLMLLGKTTEKLLEVHNSKNDETH